MSTYAPVQLPPGHRPGSLAMRVLAVLVDGTLPSLVVTGWWALVSRGPITVGHFIVVSVLAAIVLLGWSLFVWWSGAQRGATPGMRLLDLEVVDVRDGLPVGWGRFFARQMVYHLLASTVVGLLLMLTWLVLDPARRGWHDRAGGAVVVQRAARRTEVAEATGDPHPTPRAAAVALPAHLQGGASFRPVDTPGLGAQSYGGQTYGGQGHGQAYAGPGAPGGLSAWQPPSAPQGVPSWNQDPPPDRAPLGELDWGTGDDHRAGGWQPPQVAPREEAYAPQEPGPYAPQGSSRVDADRPRAIGGPAQRPEAELTMPPPFAEATLPPPIAAVPSGNSPDQRPADEGTVLRQPAAGDQPTGEGTVLRPRTPMTPWQVLLEDGRSIPLGAGILLGRGPVAGPGEERLGLIEVADTTRTISKTHLLVAADEGGPFISDRGSTNGSGVIAHDGRLVECEPGGLLRVEEGQMVTFGDHRLIVRRGAV
ncbi:RDD family protein [Mariniluteicoccus flavus]